MATPLAQKVIDQAVAHFSSQTGVAALVLVGSQVEGNAFPPDQFSDIELYVVAYDDQYSDVEQLLNQMDKVFPNSVFTYKNQWAGQVVVFTNLLRLEMPLAKASDESVFSRASAQGLKVLYQKPDFQLKTNQPTPQDAVANAINKLPEMVKDFWYMLVYCVQHVGRGELFMARHALLTSPQKIVFRLIQFLNHPDSIALDPGRRLELTWSPQELQIIKDTSCSYDKQDITRAILANIESCERLLEQLKTDKDLDQLSNFRHYKDLLLPAIKDTLGK